MRVAGIMSGTSLDGIDVAIVDIRGRKLKVEAFSSTPYPRRIREAILGVSNTTCHSGTIARLHFLLAELYAEAVIKLCDPQTLDLVGCHGQTIFHEGRPRPMEGRKIASTLQIGDGSVLAERLGVPVVSDFRPRDIAAGGQGAPLVPFLDYLLFRHARLGRVALNIGGIANITAIPAAATPEQVFAFDTGPGNMVMDALAYHATDGRLNYDRDGKLAARGQVLPALLDRWLKAPFFRQPPPKSAGREQYGVEFVEPLLRWVQVHDLIATATAFTAASIAQSIERFVRPKMEVQELIAAGGGVHNPVLMGHLAQYLPGVKLRTVDEFGVSSDAKEAVAFAVLAAETWRKRPSNVPSATGARRPVILGKISY